MGFYLKTKVSELSKGALLDQHRTCHSYILRMGFLRTESFGGVWKKDILILHENTVSEMLKRGLNHSTPLYRKGPDYLPDSREKESAILVKQGHPQLMAGKPCPLCTADNALEIVNKVIQCRHCKQEFQTVKEQHGSPAT